MSWTNVFSGNAVAPSSVQYLALALTANVTLVWPLESAEGADYMAAQIDVTPSGSGFAIDTPPANQGSTGIASVITNLGADNFDVNDNGGNLIVTIEPGLTWIVSLTDNSTVNGVWSAIQLGATTSNAQAAALAGNGLQAFTTLLQSRIVTNSYSADHTLSVSHRASANIWTGAIGTFTLDTLATVTVGWWAIVSNAGTGVLTVATSGGDTIDGAATVTIPVSGTDQGYAVLVVAAAGGFNTFYLPPIPTPVVAGGTGASDAPTALTNLGGTVPGISIFTAPTVAAILAILGITQTLLHENTLTTDEVVATNSTGSSYVCTASLILSLPEAATVTTSFYFCVYAQGGTVTIVPSGTDAIDGGTGGASFAVAQGSSLLMTTDAASPGNWWPFFLATAPTTPSGTWAAAGGTVNAITVTYSPAQAALTDGLILGFRAAGANTSTAPTFSPDGLTAHNIVKNGGEALQPGDISAQNAECLVRYNAANTWWELMNPSANGGGYGGGGWVVAGGAADALTATYDPAVATLYDGLLLGVRAVTANTTTTPTFSPDGLTARTITKNGGLPLIAGDIAGNFAELLLRYNAANTRWELLNPAFSATGSGGGGGNSAAGVYTGLKLINGGSPDSQVAITARSVTVAPTGGVPGIALTSINLVADISASGANGLDTGSVAPSTWYSVWIIYNGTVPAALLSTSATAPTLPSGYTYFARVGWVRTDGSSNLERTLQYGNEVRYTTPPHRMANGVLGSPTIPTWSTVSVSSYVPTTASMIAIYLEGYSNTITIAAPNNTYGAYDSTTNPPPISIYNFNAAVVSVESAVFMLESSSIYWASAHASSAIYCYGWTDNL